jgi:hypothetical protein
MRPALVETLKYIDKQLIAEYGIATDNGKPMWRVVSSWDQYEHRLQSHVDGMQLIHPEVRLVPKYDQRNLNHLDQYVLERLVIVPINNLVDLPSSAQSYEPHYFFRSGVTGEPLPPKFYVAKFLIDVFYAAQGKGKGMAKYVDEEAKNPVEHREARLKELEEYLFGDESFLLGRTITGEAVGYTGPPTIEPVKE